MRAWRSAAEKHAQAHTHMSLCMFIYVRMCDQRKEVDEEERFAFTSWADISKT